MMILNRIPLGVIEWTDLHLNHPLRPRHWCGCVSRWFCRYAELRAAETELQKMRKMRAEQPLRVVHDEWGNA